jgi:solute carrier family 25 carnitine/acylcarnitine transporter 20/29
MSSNVEPVTLISGERASGFLAGVIAGGCGVLVGHAFDSMKVQQQLGRSPVPTSFWVLYRGVVPPLVSAGAIRSLYFGIYESSKSPIISALGAPDDDLLAVFLAAAVAGFATSLVSAPVQRLKLLQQSHGITMRESLRRLLASPSAVRNVYRGVWLHSALETIGSACYLLTYEASKLRLLSSSADASQAKVLANDPLASRVACGMIAGCSGWLSIYPLDVLRSRIMSAPFQAAADGRGGFERVSVVSVARETLARHGIAGFYRGLGWTLLRAGPVAGISLPMYDETRAWLRNLDPSRVSAP